MKKFDTKKIRKGKIGKQVSLICDELITSENFIIQDKVTITARKIIIGNGSVLESGLSVHSLTKNNPTALFSLGDQSVIGFNTQIRVPSFQMGDYSRLHNQCLVSGYNSITIGHNCWIGQQSILNATETLTIRNNVRIGTQSQLWTHVASGELLEGCLLFGKKPLILEDNVWLVGGAVVSPGLVLKRNSVIMTGSVLTKSTEAYHTYAGVPAQDITQKLNAWKHMDLEEKFKLLQTFVKEFIFTYPEFQKHIHCIDMNKKKDRKKAGILLAQKEPVIIIFKKIENWKKYNISHHSIYNLETKQYGKRSTAVEINWMNFITGYRARFIPYIGDS